MFKGIKDKIKNYGRRNKNSAAAAFINKLVYYRKRLLFAKFKYLYPVEDNLIVFESFNGRSFSDNPRAIYETILADPAYAEFRFVWAFRDAAIHEGLFADQERSKVVRKNSRAYFRAYAAAKYWVNNAGMADYLMPRKGQVYIETWHGTPLKRICADIVYDNFPLRSLASMKKKYMDVCKKVDYMPSASEFYEEKITSAFLMKEVGKKNVFVKTGFPRNDRLFDVKEETVRGIKKKLNIPFDKKVVLYTPTWRNTEYAEGQGFVYQDRLNPEQVLSELGSEYVLLFRMHYLQKLSAKSLALENVYDVSNYDDINDLYMISDLLITDYSSTMFDYAILKRPMLFYMYDKDEYMNEQTGTYFGFDELPGPIITQEVEVAPAIKQLIEHFSYDEKYQAFNKKFNQYSEGCASTQLLAACMPLQGDQNLTYAQAMKQHKFMRYLYLPCAAINNLLRRVCLKIGSMWRGLKKNLKRELRRLYYNVTGFFKKRGFCRSKNSKKLYSYKNKYKGKRCFVVGSGPSLTVSDLELLKDEYTFGCNMLFKMYDKTSWRPSFYCVSDRNYAKGANQELVENVKEPTFTVRSTYMGMQRKMKELVYINDLFNEKGYKFRGNPMAYCMVKATVLAFVIEIAVFMGFEEIYLIGVDCTDPHAKNGHFIENYVDKNIVQMDMKRLAKRLQDETITVATAGQHIVNRMIEVYQIIKKAIDKRPGVTIYNATRGGELEVFERRNLDEVLQQKEKR